MKAPNIAELFSQPKPIDLLSVAALLLAALAAAGHAATPPWTPDDFQGRRMDYALWLREGHGWYEIDDDPEYEWSGIVNNALLTLAFGDREKAWATNALEAFRTGTAAGAFHDQLLWAIRKSVVPEDANRVWADALEAYLLLKDRFMRTEQGEIEHFFARRAQTYAEAAKERWGHQYVPHAFAALTGHALSRSMTGADYTKDVAWLWRYAQEKSYDFGEIMGPVEHSGHYIIYTYPAMMRVGIWVDGRNGRLPEEHKPNLKRAVQWVLDVYPPSGFAVTYGTEWTWAHVPRLIEFLHAAAFYLNDGQAENVRLARNAKWLATEMFRFGFQHTPKHWTWVEWTPRAQKRAKPPGKAVQANPLLLWRYVDDALRPERPDVDQHGSKVVFGEWGNTYAAARPARKASHVVHRSGWDSEALYLLLDLAPRCGKSMPYANAICDISFAGEPFTPGHRLEQGNAGNQQTWNERIVVEPHGGDRWEAEAVWMHNDAAWSASHTREGQWSRLVSFAKEPAHAVVFDFAPADGEAHWQFVSDPTPTWHADWVELARHGRRLEAHYPNAFNWYEIRHWDDTRLNDANPKDDVWAVDDPAGRLTLRGARSWAVALIPRRGEKQSVASAIQPTRNGQPDYPAAVGMKIHEPDATDWHGARREPGTRRYDAVTTDAELFWARQSGNNWTVRFVNASQIGLALPPKPTAVELDGQRLAEGTGWTHEDGLLLVPVRAGNGMLRVRLRDHEKGAK